MDAAVKKENKLPDIILLLVTLILDCGHGDDLFVQFHYCVGKV
jgi:hypothetical protein